MQQFIVVYLTPETLEQGVKEGWLNDFQKGMRNADGSPRESMYMMNLADLPDSLVIGCGQTYDKESILLFVTRAACCCYSSFSSEFPNILLALSKTGYLLSE